MSSSWPHGQMLILLWFRYDRLGIHWAAALPGFIALALIPFTVLFYKYGASIRAKCKYAADAERQMAEIMASRAAQKKTDEEDNVTSSGQKKTEPIGGARGAVAGKEKAGDSMGALQAQPVEQEGEMGTIGQDITNEKLGANPNYRPPTSRNKQDGLDEKSEAATADQLPSSPKTSYRDWLMYEALADRDESDLTWDERIRLEQLHRRFNYAMAMPGSSYVTIPVPEWDIGTVTRTNTRVSGEGMRGGAGWPSQERLRSPSLSHLPENFRLGQPV